jgi:hypothetical protein
MSQHNIDLHSLDYNSLVKLLTKNITPSYRSLVLQSLIEINNNLINQEQNLSQNYNNYNAYNDRFYQPPNPTLNFPRTGQLNTRKKDLTEQKHPSLIDDGGFAYGKTNTYFQEQTSQIPTLDIRYDRDFQSKFNQMSQKNFNLQDFNRQFEEQFKMKAQKQQQVRQIKPQIKDDDFEDLLEELDIDKSDEEPENSEPDQVEEAMNKINALFKKIQNNKSQKIKKVTK